MPALDNVGNEPHAQFVTRRFRDAADALLAAAAELQHEANWIDSHNFPDPSWSDETTLSYLRSSTLSRLGEVKNATKRACDVLTATDECLSIEAEKVPERKCWKCGSTDLDEKGYGLVCPQGHITEERHTL